ncbi:MAG: efflux RND transporter periplasmic adaptor subunit [Flavobacteriaceae bacterium]
MRYLLTLILVLYLLSCDEGQEKTFPKKMQLTESVYASATVQPDSLYEVHSAVAGILDRNLVEEGDLVKNGTPLLQIINTTPKLNTENARLALELAQKNYKGSSAILYTLEEEIRSAELSFQNDSINYFRQKRLWEQQIGSKVSFESKKLAYELARNNLALLKTRFNQTKNELETQLFQTQNNYRTAQINTKDFTVSSKINGRVYALFKEAGEIVTTMEPLALVGSRSVFLIEMLVDEVDIVKLALDQKVLITLDAYNSEVFSARVSKIYPRKDERSQTFKVEATFENAPGTLYPGLAGEGNIVIAKKENILTIPKEYLIEGNKVQTKDGMASVTIGLQNLDRVEILEGINENTEILKPTQ